MRKRDGELPPFIKNYNAALLNGGYKLDLQSKALTTKRPTDLQTDRQMYRANLRNSSAV